MASSRDAAQDAQDGAHRGGGRITFVLDDNLGLSVDERRWSETLPALGIVARSSTDLPAIDKALAAHEPDIAFIPTADYHRLFGKGDRFYLGLAIATSKYTGVPTQRSVLVVRKDDPANRLEDLAGAKFSYINKSCSSSYFPPAILLNRLGIRLDDFLTLEYHGAWQGQVDAVVAGTVRATMVLEDVWRSSPRNADATKIIGHLDGLKPPVVVVRQGLDEAVRRKLLDALLAWVPRWDGVYGAFKPCYYADLHPYFHELDQLPPGL